MPKTLLQLFFVLALLMSKAFFVEAKEFIIKSREDSGPGTLREALIEAAQNGTSEWDFIYFNLPGTSVSDKTITFLTDMPEVSSNLIIDGTTQPGEAFGATGAKVVLNGYAAIRGENITQLEVYGLSITGEGFAAVGMDFAVRLKNVEKLIFGSPGAGNFIEYGGVISVTDCKEFIFQDNICWSDYQGQQAGTGRMQVIGAGHITIGGSEEAGNMIAGHIAIAYTGPTDTKFCEISYNKMGTNLEGTKSEHAFWDDTRIRIEGSVAQNGEWFYSPVNGSIKNNILANPGHVQLEGLSGDFVIQGNAFDTDFSGQANFTANSVSRTSEAIVVQGVLNVLVGGENEGDKNMIGNMTHAMRSFTTGDFIVSRNSIFCMDEEVFLPNPQLENIPFVEIVYYSATSVSGRSVPGAKIELFYDDDCEGCSPRTFFATVHAGANGMWHYNGEITGTVIASATHEGLTSSFTKALIKLENMQIGHATCGLKNGFITGIEVANAQAIKWIDQDGNTVGSQSNLTNVGAGRYKLLLENEGCSTESQWIEVNDIVPGLDETQVQVTHASCDKNNGSITGLQVDPQGAGRFKLEWINQDGNIIANEADIYGLAPGTYTLLLSGVIANCSETYGPVEVKEVESNLILNDSKVEIQEATCGMANGAIRNILVSGADRYEWRDQNGRVIAQTLVLENVATGNYSLKVFNQAGCSETTEVFRIDDQSDIPDQPSVIPEISLCAPGEAIIAVQNAYTRPIHFRLYETETKGTPLAENTSGVFRVPVASAREFYIGAAAGTCESSLARVKVNLSSNLKVFNAFSPNGDGVNDSWEISGIESYPNVLIRIFNRYGDKVYQAKGYGTPFDGRYKGRNLPSGVYYYTIDLADACGQLIGSLTIIR